MDIVAGQVRDTADGAGIADVLISNGRLLARTDADGRYTLPVLEGQTVFVIKPPHCRLPLGDDGLPVFWRHHMPEGSPRLRHGGIAPTGPAGPDWDFQLDCRPAQELAATFDVLVFADPQTASALEVDYYRRDLVEPLLDDQGRLRLPARFGLTLGDVVDDDLSLYPQLNRITARLGLPWLHVAGNHDLDFDALDDAASLTNFRRHYGPDTFAYEEHNLSVVLLDNVIHQPGLTPAYVGGLREDQFAFLERYLATVDRQRLLLLAMHIPLFDTGGRASFRGDDRQRLFRLLQPFPNRLLLSGHRHGQQHYFHDGDDGWRVDPPLHEYNVGAVSGGFWGGVKDADGIPDAVMADGTANGHARLRVHGDGRYALFWHVARQPEHPGIAVHAPNVLRQGSYPAVGVHANVFMGIDGDRVEYRVGEGPWRPMTRVDAPDPRVAAINAADDAASQLRAYKRTPQALPSSHLWRGVLPTDLPAGEYAIQVRAFDRWRGELRAATSYRLEHADPEQL